MSCSFVFVLHSSEKFHWESKEQHAVQIGEGPVPRERSGSSLVWMENSNCSGKWDRWYIESDGL